MANLKDIRDRIKSVKSIQQVTNERKLVAAAKMRKAQERMEEARPYSERLSNIIISLLPDVDRALLPLLDKRDRRFLLVRLKYHLIKLTLDLMLLFYQSMLLLSQKHWL